MEDSDSSSGDEEKKTITHICMRKKSLKRIFERFSERTTLQGFGFIQSSKLITSKIFWTLVTLAAFVAMVIHVSNVFIDYYKYPKQTTVSLGYGNLELPAITICNINILKQSKLESIPHGKDLKNFLKLISSEVEEKKNKIDEDNKNLENTNWDSVDFGGWDDFGTEDNTTRGKRQSDPMLGDSPDQGWTAEEGRNETTDYQDLFAGLEEMQKTYSDIDHLLGNAYVLEQQFKSLYVDIPREERLEAGHHIKDMLVNCSIAGRLCQPENFHLHQSSDHGNCWTFKTHDIVRDTGPQLGLKLVLYMENYEFINRLTHGYGARVVIHPQQSLPVPKHEGFFVSSGFETDIALRKTHINRLAEPYGDCQASNAFLRNYDIEYTRQACLKVCRTTRMVDLCNCYDVDDEDILVYLNLHSFPRCKTLAELNCSRDFQKQFWSKEKEIGCRCTNPCVESVYTKETSQITWPSDYYVATLEGYACAKWNNTCDKLNEIKDKRVKSTNFLKMNIYYSDLNFEQILEEPQYTVAGFMSDLGGATGLWIGLSLMSLFEFIPLLLDLLDFGVNRMMLYSEKQIKKTKEKTATGRGTKVRPTVWRRLGDTFMGTKRGKGSKVNNNLSQDNAEMRAMAEETDSNDRV